MAIWGGLMHRCSTDEAPQHQYCPAGANSWCKWQQVRAGIRPSYEHKPAIPKAVFDVLKPIYVKLSERQLLERCLMDATQNSNESFNAIVWSMCPKEGFCELKSCKLPQAWLFAPSTLEQCLCWKSYMSMGVCGEF